MKTKPGARVRGWVRGLHESLPHDWPTIAFVLVVVGAAVVKLLVTREW
jgi:hypothetical protein